MLAPGKKSCDQPRQNIKKQRHDFADKGLSSQSYGFPSSHVWMWELDNKKGWAPKNWCFWTEVLEKTFESPLDSRRSNHFILKEISPEYSLEGLMLKLKPQYLGHLMWRANSLEKTLMLRMKAGGEGDDRGWDGWMASLTRWTWTWGKFWEMMRDREARHAAVHEVAKSWTWLSEWTELNWCMCCA